MHLLLATVVLAGSPVEPVVELCPTHQVMAQQLADEVQTGTLLFSQGDCLAVKVFSRSEYTHVATVVVEDKQPMVYESTNGVGVRKLSLEKYIAVNAPDELHVYQPKFDFNKNLQQPFVSHLKQELGRPYSVKHHLTGKRCEGLHCAEYVTDALMASDIMRAENPPKVSPGSLRDGIAQANRYHETHVLNLEKPEPVRAEGDGWCESLWLDTKYCTQDCYSSFKRTFLCR
ncbi:MAG: YiiX/YebB-like N1pC/P60 family cysteine hydrolase [Planctomycetaceae bacterium]|jgi:hypothetical protein|nr:YiiX/YebB-like N1pC/P60 family cysteine hydrolase [Planctomycetaceae bacterium]MDG2390636.1 YiiX/YebB-like N1pC/P60 family cysteine hydrolase [Planctomycetaceae bacterium]